MKKNLFIALTIAGASVLIGSCKKTEAEYGRMIIRLTDAPTNAYQEVNVEIKEVTVHVVPASSNGQWVSLKTKSGIYDLLKLQNGIDTTIAETDQIPVGKVTQVRLILGTNNTVLLNNVSYPLTVPSGTNTGLKLPGPIDVTPNAAVQILLDFDASKSVLDKGNQEFQLKPVIQLMP